MSTELRSESPQQEETELHQEDEVQDKGGENTAGNENDGDGRKEREEEDFRKIFSHVAPYIDRHLDSLSKELGISPEDQEVLRLSCVGQTLNELVKKILLMWHDRERKGVSAERLVGALRKVRLNKAADSVEEFCMKVHRPSKQKRKEGQSDIGQEQQNTSSGDGKRQEIIPDDEMKKDEMQLGEIEGNMACASPGRHKRQRGGNLFIRFFIDMKPRQDTTHTPLAKEGVQPLLRLYHDHVIKEQSEFRLALTKEIGIDGVEVVGFVDHEICIFGHLFVKRTQALRQLHEYYDRGVLRDRCQRVLLDDVTLEETKLHNLPLDSRIEITEESFNACHDEIRLTRAVKRQVKKKDANKEMTQDTDNKKDDTEAKVPPASKFEHTVVFVMEKNPELIDMAIIPGIENGLVLLDKEVPRILVCQCWRDRYTPKKKLLRTIASFSGEGKFRLQSPIAVASWNNWIVVAEKTRECLLYFTLEGDGVRLQKLHRIPVNLEMRQNRLWIAYDGRVEGNRLIGSPEDDNFKWELFRFADISYIRPVQLSVNERGDMFVVSQTTAGRRYLYLVQANRVKKPQPPAKLDTAGIWATAIDSDDSVLTITNDKIERVKVADLKFDKDSARRIFPALPEGETEEAEGEAEQLRKLRLCSGSSTVVDREGDLLICLNKGEIKVFDRK